MTKPRIVHLYLDLPIGGAEDITASLQLSMSATHDIRVLCLRSLGALGEELLEAGRAIEHLPLVERKRFTFGAFAKLKDWLVENRVDLVHTHVYHAHLYGVVAARMAGIKVIMHHHKTFQKTKLRRSVFMRALSRLAHFHITLSERTKEDIARNLRIGPSRIAVLPNTVNPEVFHPAEDRATLRAELGWPGKGFWIGTAASMNPQKNHAFSVKMIGALSPELPELRFLLLGDGPLRLQLEEQVQRMGLGKVFLMPGRKRPLAPWMQALDVFVLISTWEGESLALLQALACGLPVVASGIEGNVSILGEGHPGLVPVVPVETYAARIREISGNPAFIRSIIEYQRTSLPVRLNHQEYLARVAGIYREVIQRTVVRSSI